MPGDKEQLIEELSKHGLGRVAAPIVAHAKPAIGISTDIADDRALAIETSKIGGLPDLPEGVAWPTVQGYSLSFVAQLNLADANSFDEEHILPPHGLLSFFFGSNRDIDFDDDDADRLDAIVLHNSIASPLQRKDPPDDLMASVSSNMSYGRVYRPYQIGFYRKLTLPDVDAKAMQRLGLTEAERNSYIDLYVGRINTAERETKQRSHQMLGYPRQIEIDPRISCYLASINRTIDDWTSSTSEEQEKIEREAGSWRLLLQLDSDPQADMIWETMGTVYYCIRVEDLQGGRFDRVQATMGFV